METIESIGEKWLPRRIFARAMRFFRKDAQQIYVRLPRCSAVQIVKDRAGGTVETEWSRAISVYVRGRQWNAKTIEADAGKLMRGEGFIGRK